jgi:hypothetical protein
MTIRTIRTIMTIMKIQEKVNIELLLQDEHWLKKILQ